MSALEVNGITVSVRPGDNRGRRMATALRTARGNRLPADIAGVRGFDYVTARPFKSSEMRAWLGLLRGEGHVWDFKHFNIASTTGISPRQSSTSSVALISAASGGKFNEGYLRVGSSYNANIQCLPASRGSAREFSVIARVATSSTTSPDCWALSDDGVVYKNGVVDTLPGWLQTYEPGVAYVDNPGIALAGRSNDNLSNAYQYFSELVVLPYRAPASWLSVWSQRTTRWPSLPVVEVTGDDFDATVNAVIEVGNIREVEVELDGAHDAGATSFDLAIREIPSS